jgi:hypothetical protein
MAPFNFPDLPGLTWSVHKLPSYSTRLARHVSGRVVAAPFYAVTLYEFHLTIEGMDSGTAYPGLGARSLQALMGLYMQCQGQFGTFLYRDPTDSSVTGQIIGIGDGVTTTFPLLRSLGGATESAPGASSQPVVYLSGVVQSAGWSLTSANAIQFTIAPSVGTAITADFTYSFNCRFLDDQEDFEEFMNGLWQVQSLKFRSTKPAAPWFPVIDGLDDCVGPLPTSDPGIPGALWSDSGFVAISNWNNPFLTLPASPPFAPSLWNNSGFLSISNYASPLIPLSSSLPASSGIWWNDSGRVAFS